LYEGSDQIVTFNIEDENLKETLKSGIFDICIGKNDEIWFASFSDGVYKYNRENKSARKYLSDSESDF